MNDFISFLMQHWMLASLFVALVIAIFVVESITSQGLGNGVTPQQAVELMNRQDAVVVDVRSRDAFVRGHIIHAVHLPFTNLLEDIQKLKAHKDKPIIVVCAQGQEAVKAAKQIASQDFKQVKILQGGMAAWRKDGLPLEKKS